VRAHTVHTARKCASRALGQVGGEGERVSQLLQPFRLAAAGLLQLLRLLHVLTQHREELRPGPARGAQMCGEVRV
jgi:hypothetical protein